MTDEVSQMIALRHGAEQRGNYEPFGRVQWFRTVHGLIYFPADSQTGEGCGPDLARAMLPPGVTNLVGSRS